MRRPFSLSHFALLVLFFCNTQFVLAPIFQSQASQSAPPKCECGNVTFTATATKADGTAQTVLVAQKLSNTSTGFNSKFDQLDIRDGDIVTLVISDIRVECPCKNGAEVSGQCQNYPGKSIGGPDLAKPGEVKIKPGGGETPENDWDAANDNHRCIRIKDPNQPEGWSGGSYKMTLQFKKLNSTAPGCFHKIVISTYCVNPECDGKQDGKLCFRGFNFNFKKPV